ncbi:flgN protein [Mariprofundus micogutta]|uniref:FlgN protein n=1 Tax=Mariprofundus micogutta TaxID=1921010 RepID=A0A1L8CKK1_9PROT|nr:flagellar export chaperone FlgN [Mariprofundus micogutta]GAV19433.1 flgN protein [Mariprofundus micogutta]
MVINQLSAETMQQLRNILEQMNNYAVALEEVSKQEQDAIHVLDSDRIMQLSDRRVALHQQLAALEAECHGLLRSQGIADDMTLAVVIDMYCGSNAADFQALRRKLYERIIHVDKCTQDNRLHLLAAYNVTSTILQQLGLSQNESTYSRSTVK